MGFGSNHPEMAGEDWEQEAELCLQLQSSLDWAYQRRQAGLPSWDGEWGEAFFQACRELASEEGEGVEMIYLAAHQILAIQARAGRDRPLARRILADPGAFARSLSEALRSLDFNF